MFLFRSVIYSDLFCIWCKEGVQKWETTPIPTYLDMDSKTWYGYSTDKACKHSAKSKKPDTQDTCRTHVACFHPHEMSALDKPRGGSRPGVARQWVGREGQEWLQCVQGCYPRRWGRLGWCWDVTVMLNARERHVLSFSSASNGYVMITLHLLKLLSC